MSVQHFPVDELGFSGEASEITRHRYEDAETGTELLTIDLWDFTPEYAARWKTDKNHHQFENYLREHTMEQSLENMHGTAQFQTGDLEVSTITGQLEEVLSDERYSESCVSLQLDTGTIELTWQDEPESQIIEIHSYTGAAQPFASAYAETVTEEIQDISTSEIVNSAIKLLTNGFSMDNQNEFYLDNY